jgi:hypothetical protein
MKRYSFLKKDNTQTHLKSRQMNLSIIGLIKLFSCPLSPSPTSRVALPQFSFCQRLTSSASWAS